MGIDKLYDYLYKLSEKYIKARNKQVAAITTKEQFYQRQDEIRKLFRSMLLGNKQTGSLISAVSKGRMECDGYYIEKLILEPEPGYFIPANLYIPAGMGFPRPAVLTPVGHYNEGKSVDVYQKLCAGLAARGFITLVFDPPGQGERDMYPEYVGEDRIGCCVQHSNAGNLAYLLGENFTDIYLQDCIYALDYLCTRPEVDKERIACTGHSGGGTATAFLSSIDDRVKAAVPMHCLSDYLNMFEQINHSGDPDQSVFGLISSGLDMHDLIWMTAPRPFLINAAIKDFYPIEGVRELYREMKKYYEMLGIPEKLGLTEVDCEHEITMDVRENTYNWISRWLGVQRTSPDDKIYDTPILSDKVLQCTETGNIAELRGLSPFDIYRRKNDEYSIGREAWKEAFSKKTWQSYKDEVSGKLKELLNFYPDEFRVEAYEVDRKDMPGYTAWEFLLQTDETMQMGCKLYKGAKEDRKRRLIVSVDSKGFFNGNESLIEKLIHRGFDLLLLEPPGFELSKASDINDRRIYSEDHKFSYYAFINGSSIFGIRILDCVKAIKYFSHGNYLNDIVFVGTGQGGLLGMLLGALEKNIAGVISMDSISCYSQFFKSKDYAMYPSDIINGIIKFFDLDVVAACTAPNPLMIVNPLDETNTPIADEKEAFEIYGFTRKVFDRITSEEKLGIITGIQEKDKLILEYMDTYFTSGGN